MKFYQVFLTVLCSYQIHFLAGRVFFVQVAVVLLVGTEQGSSLYILVVVLGLA